MAPYCLALLPPARCKGGFRAHSSPAARLRGEIPPFLALFPGWGRCSRTLARGTTPLAAGGGPGWGRTLSRCPWAGWRGRTGRAAPAASGQSEPGPLRTAPHSPAPRRGRAGLVRGSRAGGEARRSGVGPGAGGLEGDALGRGRRCHSRRRGARSPLQPRSPVSQSPFQPLCGLLTGGGWSYIKAHYENYNIGPRACPRRQLGSFQALSPCSAGLSCKISI